MIRKVSDPRAHKFTFGVREIKIIAAKEKKVEDVATVEVSGKSFIGGHEIANAGRRIVKIGNKEIKKRKKPETV